MQKNKAEAHWTLSAWSGENYVLLKTEAGSYAYQNPPDYGTYTYLFSVWQECSGSETNNYS